MCLAAIALQQHSDFPFVCIANRDEFHARPCAALAPWPEIKPTVYAGRDLQAGGTWLGVSERGLFSLLTNVRNPELNMPANAPSRGALVLDALQTGGLPSAQASLAYPGFNLFLADLHTEKLKYCSNQWLKLGQQNKPYERHLGNGIYSLSNGNLDSEWPKSVRLKSNFATTLRHTGSPNELAERLFNDLADQTLAEDKLLPSTGVPYEWEKMLSAIKIVSPMYGTRSSTVILKHRSGVVRVYERSFDSSGDQSSQVQISINLNKLGNN